MAVFAKNSILLPAAGYNLTGTLFCGQSFAWQQNDDGSCTGVAGGRAAVVAVQDGRLVLRRPQNGPISDEDVLFWRHYFALDEDYTALEARFCADAELAQCVAAAPGIRVLHQPFWDTLLSFIISQNNHIPRITAILRKLREDFGPVLEDGLHDYPTPEQLAALSPEALAPLSAGYRARYLVDAAHRVASGQLNEEKLAGMADEEVQKALCTIAGVGPKVAQCVMLYGLGRSHIAPMDVWMKRAAARWFPHGWPACCAGAEGIAQQYIFVRARREL